MTPIVDDDDLKKHDMYSEELLVDKYRKNFETIIKARPPIEESQEMKQKREELLNLLGSDGSILGNPIASNNWVVHGDHTATGMPLLASDPHLENQVPATWSLYNLKWPDGRILSGAQLPGVPGIGIGRNNNMAWGLTTSRVDTSDLWQEKLNEDQTEYFVDGVWKKLEVRSESIKVKGQPDKVLQIKKTHRGPIMQF